MMRAPVKLGLYATALVGVFVLAFVTAGAVVPAETVRAWSAGTEDHAGEHGGPAQDHAGGQGPTSAGLSLAAGGYRLSGVGAPTTPQDEGSLTLTVLAPDGQPATEFDRSHEKELHLIVVRTDGAEFRHVHPERDDEGKWSIPWEWQAAGTYRVFAEFVPSDTGEDLTLSTLVQVGAGVAAPTPREPVIAVEADGYQVSLGGGLVAGEPSTLTFSVERDGDPVTDLEPYLGAFGHLVALREGDLAFLHVHPHGQEPRPGERSGPEVTFEVTAPTPGRYLLYLDFQTAGEVHTAAFVLDTDAVGPGPSTVGDDETIEHEEGHEHDHDE